MKKSVFYVNIVISTEFFMMETIMTDNNYNEKNNVKSKKSIFWRIMLSILMFFVCFIYIYFFNKMIDSRKINTDAQSSLSSPINQTDTKKGKS